jgi:hypothetical protein
METIAPFIAGAVLTMTALVGVFTEIKAEIKSRNKKN